MPDEDLAAELVNAGVAGWIGTPLHDVYRKARLLAAGDHDTTLGLDHLLPTSVGEVIDALGKLARWAVPAAPGPGEGCYVDPEAAVEQAYAAAQRIRTACERRERVLFGTGHPAGPLGLYIALARAMRDAGAEVMEFAEGEPFEIAGWRGRCSVRYVCGVGCLYAGGSLLHTHNWEPMAYLLDTGPRPDLVVGDHGFAGAGLARGTEAVAIVDTNDPALLLAWGRGLRVWPILCDDNRPPAAYDPFARLITTSLR